MRTGVFGRGSLIRGQLSRGLEEVRKESCWCQGEKFQIQGTSEQGGKGTMEGDEVRGEPGPDLGGPAQLLLWDPILPRCLAAKGSQLNGSLGDVLSQGELLPPSHVSPWGQPTSLTGQTGMTKAIALASM